MKKKHLQPLTPAALYARVSSDRQDVDLSVSAQLRALKEYAKANGYSVAREYVDEAESGRVADRPQVRRGILLRQARIRRTLRTLLPRTARAADRLWRWFPIPRLQCTQVKLGTGRFRRDGCLAGRNNYNGVALPSCPLSVQ